MYRCNRRHPDGWPSPDGAIDETTADRTSRVTARDDVLLQDRRTGSL
jgi:hypothetical protein